ncbi:hypothetical protein, partial [Methylobacter tundripaludum]|uniref:hypothetical protein n=1 Tax=Methylobacter tundripaludum TaxID=173365 RepID=UPI00215802CD
LKWLPLNNLLPAEIGVSVSVGMVRGLFSGLTNYHASQQNKSCQLLLLCFCTAQHHEVSLSDAQMLVQGFFH